MPDSTPLPAALRQQLNTLQQNNDLEHWLYARIDYVDAKPYERIGFLMQTEAAAWRSYQTYEGRLAWFKLLILQGYYQLQTGNILSSINAYEKALAFYEAYPLPDADIIEYVLKPLGNNYTRLADYETALFIHRKTLALAQQQKRTAEIAAVYSNMAICARWQGHLTAAMEYVQKGMAVAQRQQSLYGLLLGTAADVLTEEGRYDTAALIVQQSLHHLKQFPKDTTAVYWYASALQMAARIALLQQHPTQARRYAQEAMQCFKQYYPLTRQREKAKVQVLLGEVALQYHQPAEALQAYQQALRWLLPSWIPASLTALPPDQLLYSENTLADALAGKAAALQQKGQKAEALDHYLLVFTAAATLRAAFYHTTSRLQELDLLRKRAEAAMQLAYGLWQSTRQNSYRDQLLVIAELSKAQLLAEERNSRAGNQRSTNPADSQSRKLRQLQDAVIYYQHELATKPGDKAVQTLLQETEYELALLNKHMREGQAPVALTPLSLATLSSLYKQLPDKVTALEFFEGSDSSYILELTNKGIAQVQVIGAGKALSDTIQQFMHYWFAQGPKSMINQPRTFYTQCYRLYQRLFAGYHWQADKTYLLIPDGQFSYLPFEALVTNASYTNNYSQWPYLFKQATLSQAYSLLTWCQQQATDYGAPGFTGFFVVKGRGQKQAALSVAEEYFDLQGYVAGNLLEDSLATWKRFNQEIRKTQGILHISTHAVSSSEDSLPWLQLYDQPFYLFDLRYLHFAPSLVVLGACKTADGEWLSGEGVNSLARGFTAAGAGGVVSSRWNANDLVAVRMMKDFYRQLEWQQDPVQALQASRTKWLADKNIDASWHLPYYWASMSYSGHLRPVLLPVEKRWLQARWVSYVFTAGILLLIGGGVFMYYRMRH